MISETADIPALVPVIIRNRLHHVSAVALEQQDFTLDGRLKPRPAIAPMSHVPEKWANSVLQESLTAHAALGALLDVLISRRTR